MMVRPAASNVAVDSSRLPQTKSLLINDSASGPAWRAAMSRNGAKAACRCNSLGTMQADRASPLHDSAHLAHRCGAVRDEHQHHLAEHDVEGLLVERKRARVASAPVEVGLDTAGNRQHGLVQVDTGDGADRADELGSGPGDDAGAASDVEHGLAGGDGRGGAKDRCPLGEEGRDELRLVTLCSLDRDLKRLDGFGHVPSLRRPGRREHRAGDRLDGLVVNVLGRLPHRVGHDLGPVAQVELGEDVTHVVRRGLAADVQSLGNLGIGEAGGQEAEHLSLAIGQLSDILAPVRACTPSDRR